MEATRRPRRRVFLEGSRIEGLTGHLHPDSVDGSLSRDVEGLPVVRFGRAVRVSVIALEEWIERREKGA